MNKNIIICLLLTAGLFAALSGCRKLNIPPKNIIQDQDIFTSTQGIQAYMARLYSELPIEDFRYSPARGIDFFWIISPTSATTGEALSRDQTSSMQENFSGWSWDIWGGSYTVIRDCDYFHPDAAHRMSRNFTQAQVTAAWLAEAYFVRGMTYFGLVKRFGGVPIVNTVLNYVPGTSTDSLRIRRASEKACWDQVDSDFTYAMNNLPAVNADYSDGSRANKYIAAAFESRAMLYAGSTAKYNNITLYDSKDNQICGIPAADAAPYFQKALNAAMLLDGVYSLYLSSWSATDPNAQYQNFVNLFQRPPPASGECLPWSGSIITFPTRSMAMMLWQCLGRQLIGPNGYSAETNPTLNFVEMFGGLPRNPNGTLQTLDATGHYLLYDSTMDLFANAEPRLRGTIILPGDIFKSESIEIRRGIYTGPSAGGISPRRLAVRASSWRNIPRLIS